MVAMPNSYSIFLMRDYENNKNTSADIDLHMSSALRELQLDRIFCCFRKLSLKIYCRKLASPPLYIPEYIFWVRVYIDVFHKIIFSYYLTANRTLTFGYIKWTLDVDFTGSFLDIVFGQYFRQKMGKNCQHKSGMSLSSQVFAWKYHP